METTYMIPNSCDYCGAETIMFEAGVPICIECSYLKEQGKLPMLPHPQSVRRSLAGATMEWREPLIADRKSQAA
jgi:hypothetical protein